LAISGRGGGREIILLAVTKTIPGCGTEHLVIHQTLLHQLEPKPEHLARSFQHRLRILMNAQLEAHHILIPFT
jgi:hypothetical protein